MVSILSGVKSLGHPEQWTLSFGSMCLALSGVAEPSPPWHTYSFVKPQIPQKVSALWPCFLEQVWTHTHCVSREDLSALLAAEWRLVRKEEFASQAFWDVALCNTGVLLQFSCKPLDDADLIWVGTWTPKAEWDVLHSSYQHSWLCVSLPKEWAGVWWKSEGSWAPAPLHVLIRLAPSCISPYWPPRLLWWDLPLFLLCLLSHQCLWVFET